MVCSSIAAGLGLFAILGWVSGLTLLASIRANYIPMAPSTGVAFTLLGAVLMLSVTAPAHKLVRMGVALIALLVSLLGVLKLAEFFLGVRIGLDVEAIMVRNPGMFGAVPLARMSPITAANFVLSGLSYCHHDKWDGSGYPRRLKGEEIPLAARIFAVVDVWDAMRSDRPYRAGRPDEQVREHIQALAGTHFDQRVVHVFLDLEH
jgi:hypothetical protein